MLLSATLLCPAPHPSHSLYFPSPSPFADAGLVNQD